MTRAPSLRRANLLAAANAMIDAWAEAYVDIPGEVLIVFGGHDLASMLLDGYPCPRGR